MLNKKYLLISILFLCIHAHGAASDTNAASIGSVPCAGKIQLADCFNAETMPMPGEDRCYKSFAISKRFTLANRTGITKSVFVDNATACSGVMGCIGIVEGSDSALTEQTANQIKDIATEDAWDACSLPFRNQERETIYLHAALRAVINGSLDRLKKTKDIRLSLVWFSSDTYSDLTRHPFETREGQKYIPLREVILAPIGDSTLKTIELCHAADAPQAERIELLKEYAQSSPVSHASMMLRLMPETLAAFLKQEFGE